MPSCLVLAAPAAAPPEPATPSITGTVVSAEESPIVGGGETTVTLVVP